MEEHYWLIGRSGLYCSHYTALKCKTGKGTKTFNIWLQNCYGGGEHMYVRTKQEAIEVLASQVMAEIEFLKDRLSKILEGDIEE